MKERIGYYDIAKGLGIFLVVYTHICFNTSFHINEIIYTFYMPLFFVVSGMTFKLGETLKGYVVRNFYSIMILYFVWLFLWGFLLERFGIFVSANGKKFEYDNQHPFVFSKNAL